MTRFFRLYEELWDLRTPPYERPTLFIFADLASESKLSHHQQLDLLRKIAALLKVCEEPCGHGTVSQSVSQLGLRFRHAGRLAILPRVARMRKRLPPRH